MKKPERKSKSGDARSSRKLAVKKETLKDLGAHGKDIKAGGAGCGRSR